MSLSSCLKKAGAALHPDDKAAIIAQSRVLRKQGMSVADAARQAVQMQRDAVRGLVDKATPQREVSTRPEPAKAAEPRFSRTPAEEAAAKTLAADKGLFQIPKTDKTTVREIVAEANPAIRVEEHRVVGETLYKLTMPDGAEAHIWERQPNPYGPNVYGYRQRKGGSYDPITERPGADRFGDAKGEVYTDVSRLKSGADGRFVYQIAQAFAHNTGRVFIGDPNGLSNIAMRRRTEQMLSSAIKYGTTEHLAPHPLQAEGNPAIGVSPMHWTDGDHEANIRELIRVSHENLEHAGGNPITFDDTTGTFRDRQGRVLDDGAIQRVVDERPRDASNAGVSTLKRDAVLSAVLRRSGEGRVGPDGRRVGVLESLVQLRREHPVPSKEIFYSRDSGDPLSERERIEQMRRPPGDNTANIKSTVDNIKSIWKNAPDVVLAKNMADEAIPEAVRAHDQAQRSQGATGEPEGFFYKGKVYLLTDQIHSEQDATRVLLHETLGHFGLRGTFGKDLNVVLDRVALLNAAQVRAKAAEYGLDFSKPGERRAAAEEVLAEMAQTHPEAGVVRQAIAAIRNWLRENVPGFANLKLSDDEILRQYLLPARGFVEKGKGFEDTQPAVKFSRTDDPEKNDAGVKVNELPYPTPRGDRFVVTAPGPANIGGKVHVGYYATEHEANDAAEYYRTSARRSLKSQSARWWVENQTELVQSTGLGRLDSRNRERARAQTLIARKDAVRSVAEGATLRQDEARAGWCFPLAAEAASNGIGDMVIGVAPGDVWHAVVIRDGMVYDPTFGRWFEPGVYEDLGFAPRKTLTSEEVRDFIAKSGGYAPDARNQGLIDKGPPAFSRAKAPPGEAAAEPSKDDERIRLPGAEMLDHATTRVSELIDHALDDIGVYGKIAPMSSGTSRTRAMAQAHINAERYANHQWMTMEREITKGFKSDERKAMWEAADEQNDILTSGATQGPDEGLNRLTAEQRDVVQTMHGYSRELWKRAQDVGLVKGEGVKFWAPRMMAMVDESGEYSRPTEPGQKATSGGEGRNITTSASSAKARKYETAAETEAAMNAKGGELVRDIRTMPLAMAKFERAIAGRELINQIKELGTLTGEPTVSGSKEPGFFTLDHPAFTTYRPRMTTNAEGKTVALLDETGNVVMDKTPIFISKEFEGPLQAIMSNSDGKIYSGYMLLKSKAMSGIMFSPLIHNMVIAGRAFAYAGLKLPALYFTGHAARADHELMATAIQHGMVPISGANHSMVDVGDIARGVGKEGGWGDPNESWIGLGAKKAGNAIVPGLGNALKAGVDKAGDFWHGTLLWERVGDLQMGLFKDAYGKLKAKGLDDNAAATVAAHMANRYAGAVGRENMSEMARKFANVILFSRSFNMGNVGQVKDVLYGLPAGLKAQLVEGSSDKSARIAMTFAKRKAFTGLVADLAATILVTSMVQDLVKRHKEDDWAQQLGDALAGYGTRASAAWANVKAHPTALDSYDPYRLSSTYHNEPGKQDRVDLGPNAAGRHEYMRLPTGKVIEDTIGWMTHPVDTFFKKLSPVAKAVTGVATNNKAAGSHFEIPIWDPSDTAVHKAMDIAKYLVGSQMPGDTLQTAYDLSQGKATELDKAKLEGNLTGLSISQGHPGGPEAAVAAQVEDRIQASKKYVMEAVKRDLKYGDEDRARTRLEEIGLTPREIGNTIRKIENPREGLSKAANKRFNAHATDEEKDRRDSVGR